MLAHTSFSAFFFIVTFQLLLNLVLSTFRFFLSAHFILSAFWLSKHILISFMRWLSLLSFLWF